MSGRQLPRHPTQSVMVGGIRMGGAAPVVVQSMTNTDTADVAATVEQVVQLAQAGSELVRLTVNNEAAAAAIPLIREGLARPGAGCAVDRRLPLQRPPACWQIIPACAEALAKYRINPGNVGSGDSKDSRFASMIETACRYHKPVRIGVNWGSLDQTLVAKMMDENARASEPLDAEEMIHEIMVTSALESARRAQELGMAADKIVLSCKMSGVQDLIAVYRRLAQRCDYALHLGLTEAGMGSKGIVASSAALAVLLQEGIGDTIRISLTPEPGGARTQEVVVAQELLQSMGLRAFTPMVVACPGCGRTTSTLFQQLAGEIQSYLRQQMPLWRQSHPGVEKMSVAVMGCVVNGPGESKHANIGISLPGTGENPSAPVYVDGEKHSTLKGEDIAGQFKQILNEYVEQRYPAG